MDYSELITRLEAMCGCAPSDAVRVMSDAVAALEAQGREIERLKQELGCPTETERRLAEAERERDSWKQEAVLMAGHQGIDNYQRLLDRLAEAEALLIPNRSP